jgi:hypothetical protein
MELQTFPSRFPPLHLPAGSGGGKRRGRERLEIVGISELLVSRGLQRHLGHCPDLDGSPRGKPEFELHWGELVHGCGLSHCPLLEFHALCQKPVAHAETLHGDPSDPRLAQKFKFQNSVKKLEVIPQS